MEDILLLDTFKEKFYTKFPKSDLKILDVASKKHCVIVGTKYGKCQVFKAALLRGYVPTFKSALNKYFYE
jgi:hypothetical protein